MEEAARGIQKIQVRMKTNSSPLCGKSLKRHVALMRVSSEGIRPPKAKDSDKARRSNAEAVWGLKSNKRRLEERDEREI